MPMPLLALLLAPPPAKRPSPPPPPVTITVYKSPTCGCCQKWVEQARAAGYTVRVVDQDEGALNETKTTLGVGPRLQSCHTAVAGAYVFEGHVPFDLVAKVLKERPAMTGLAVPGMVQGSPGMETGRKEPYDVLSFDRTGKATVYAKR